MNTTLLTILFVYFVISAIGNIFHASRRGLYRSEGVCAMQAAIAAAFAVAVYLVRWGS